jgi:hypothetical protein
MIEADDFEETPLKESTQPTADMTPDEVAKLSQEDPQGRFYTRALRGPNDVVLSGPIFQGWGPGRYHRSKTVAKEFLEKKYGVERVRPIAGWTRGRWAYLIKDLKKGVTNEAARS